MSSDFVIDTNVLVTPTRVHSALGNPWSATWLGIVLPIACLYFDPAFFQWDIGWPLLEPIKVGSYLAIGLGVVGLAAWLIWQRWNSVLTGWLYCGCLYASLLGIAMLPITIPTILIVIGLVGLSPFLTALVFWHAARQARANAGELFKPRLAVCAFLVYLVIPISAQLVTTKITNDALDEISLGVEPSAANAIQRLNAISYLVEIRLMIRRFQAEKSIPARKRLAAAYLAVTGEEIGNNPVMW